MEEVCELIANNWNVGFNDGYIEQTIDDEMKLYSNEGVVDYIVSQLNFYLGKAVSEIILDEENSKVSFKYNGVNFSVRQWFHSRGYGYWVVE